MVLWRNISAACLRSLIVTANCCSILLSITEQATPLWYWEHAPCDKPLYWFAGKLLSYIEGKTGKSISVAGFCSCLPLFRLWFCHGRLPSQSTMIFIHCTPMLFESIGRGTPNLGVPDNLKAAIVKASRYEPSINRYGELRKSINGTTVTPGQSTKPQDKAYWWRTCQTDLLPVVCQNTQPTNSSIYSHSINQ